MTEELRQQRQYRIKLVQELVYRALEDRVFREKLETNPEEALKESNINLPPDVERLVINRDPAILAAIESTVKKLPHNPPGEISLPVAFTVFPDEIFAAPRSWVEQVYPNLIYLNEVDKGGHFAAWEEPELFATEIRAAFRSLR